MDAGALQTPVILLVFNRPSTTARVIEAIRRIRPTKLLVIADGPRADHAGEVDLCKEARKIATDIDWPCELHTRFSTQNLGCRLNVSSGLDWAFDHVEEAIILEDDCLPDPTFFPFCEELLDLYRNNERIGQICGSNYQQGRRRTQDSYYFSRHAHIWGWATWRRSWMDKDLQMSAWPGLRRSDWLGQYLGNAKAAFYWTKVFDDSWRGSRDSLNSWAIPWTFSCWVNNRLSVIPAVNLISNIGYSGDGTHTSHHSATNRTPREAMVFPLKHPTTMAANTEADLFTEETFYYGQTVLERLFWGLRAPFSIAAVRRVRRLARNLFA